MFERELKTYGFLQGYAQLLLDGVTDEQWNVQPFAGANTPSWVIGHLTMTGQFLLQQGGDAVEMDEKWGSLFGPTSQVPAAGTEGLPSPAELREAYAATHALVTERVPLLTPATFGQPNPIERMAPALPTLGDLASFILTGHESMHLGQLSAWRRAMGMPHAIR